MSRRARQTVGTSAQVPTFSTLLELLAHIGQLDAGLVNQFNAWRKQFPGASPPLNLAEGWLRQHWSNVSLTTLFSVAMAELLELARKGSGPVTHDDVDVA